MAEIGSYYIELDVPTKFLITSGGRLSFDLTKACCNGGDVSRDYKFSLTRTMQCNGALLISPIVNFERNGNVVNMIITVPISEQDPLFVSCARALLRVEYFE